VQSLSFSNNGQLFRCIVGGLNCDDTSNIVQLTVQCLPLITVDPAPTSAYSGGTAIFSLQSGGTGSSFQWQRRLSGGSFVNVSNSGQFSGANSNQLQIQSLTLQNNQEAYRCLVSNLGCTDTSAIALLSVSCANQITQQPRDTLVRTGANVRFEVNFSPSFTYKWYRISGINLLQLSDNSQTLGTTTHSLQLLNVQLTDHNTAYVCELLQGECADTSSFAILRVDNAASVQEQGQNTLLVYPNPAHERMIIERSQEHVMSPLRIYDSLGRLFFESTSDELELVVDLRDWPVGAYFAQIGRQRTKFIVKH
jgi:hypothetical protein